MAQPAPSIPAPANLNRLQIFLLALLAPALLALPWLNESLMISGWVGLAGMLLLRSQVKGVRGFCILFATSAIALGIAFHWTPDALAYAMDSSYLAGFAVSLVILVLDTFRLCLPLWFGGYFTKNTAYLWLPCALLAVVAETFLPSVFPWRLGHMQLGWVTSIQVVDLFGAEISSIVAYAFAGLCLNAAILCFHRRSNAEELPESTSVTPTKHFAFFAHPLSIPGTVLSFALLYGFTTQAYWSTKAEAAPKLKVALVQVYPGHMESVARAQKLSDELPDDIDLVCWPESIGGTYEMKLRDLSDWQTVFDNSAEPDRGLQPWPSARFPLLLGGKSFAGPEEQRDTFVSAMLIDKEQQIVDRYHKRHLMPFGEYVPLQDTLPFMDSIFGQWDDLVPADDAHVVSFSPDKGKEVQIGAMLCYEDMVSEAARDLVANDANLLVSLIDGSSFDNPLTLTQHRMLAQMRAIENRKTFVRCAGTGDTCGISPTGVIEAQLPPQEDSCLIYEAPILESGLPLSTAPGLPATVLGVSLLLHLFVRLRVPNPLARSKTNPNESLVPQPDFR